MPGRLFITLTFVCLFLVVGQLSAQETSLQWPANISSRLDQAGDNRAELESALQQVTPEHRQALEFLIEHMPEGDLRSLSAEFLIDNIELAYTAIDQVPWGEQIPDSIFLNDVLPYASVDETREAWRKEMMDRCLKIVTDCQTPGEAAQKLNRELFPLINVRYATSREKANQSPSESMDQSVASCTGLSILLTDACRSVGVPARLAGTPSWTKKRGNHTWVEVWDGEWQFTGAAEPSDQGLNHAWFSHDASQADASQPLNRIYATSFAETGLYFPMVWSMRSRDVPAVDVTQRYTEGRTEQAASLCRVLIGIRSADGTRLSREITVSSLQDEELRWSGNTRDESADLNDLLSLQLPRNHKFRITWQENGQPRDLERATEASEQVYWELQLDP
ncbi:MAG: transglutaminase-like domain-containing protein [Pirellulaceae bacterium]